MTYKPIDQGGLYRCCVKTLEEYIGNEDEGTIIKCQYCREGQMWVHLGVWKWKR